MCVCTNNRSLILFGMPGAGKSTLGKALARQRRQVFVDTDDCIEAHTGESLQASLDRLGYVAMRALEAEVICQQAFASQSVIATGGSVVYSAEAVAHLQDQGLCVWLDISLETLKSRVSNWSSRGFNRKPGQSVEEVFAERQSLYQRACSVRIDCDRLDEPQVLELVAQAYEAWLANKM